MIDQFKLIYYYYYEFYYYCGCARVCAGVRGCVQVCEIVHVGKESWAGLAVAGISRVDVMSVIKPEDKVFLGHKIKACQFSGNVRRKIVERAIACAEKPKILFAYDPKYFIN